MGALADGGVPWISAIVVPAAAAALSAGLIVVLLPAFRRYALARPNARSSHTEPTPQGGGIAVVAAALVVAWLAIQLGFVSPPAWTAPLAVISVAAVLLALAGAYDDIREAPLLLRLVVQFVAAALLIWTLPAGYGDATGVPVLLIDVVLAVAVVWFVNLVNFMDGLDWITVAEVVPVAIALSVFGLAGLLPPTATIVALALLGATLGFAPFNRPVARLFLGDVGSLPLGLLIAWLLLLLAASQPAAALLLPLYYLGDATLTLLRRLVAGEPFWQAHRTHFYQRATDGGFSVPLVVGGVFILNAALVVLALTTILAGRVWVDLVAVAVGSGLVAWRLAVFGRGGR